MKLRQHKYKVPDSKLTAFLKEFPWLQRHLEEVPPWYMERPHQWREDYPKLAVTEIGVERFDASLAGRRCLRVREKKNEREYFHTLEDMRLFSRHGSPLATVGTYLEVPPKRWWRRNPKPELTVDEAETVVQAIRRIGSPGNDAHYVVSTMVVIREGETPCLDGYDYYDKRVVIYKPPANLTIVEFLERQSESERQKIRQAVEAFE